MRLLLERTTQPLEKTTSGDKRIKTGNGHFMAIVEKRVPTVFSPSAAKPSQKIFVRSKKAYGIHPKGKTSTLQRRGE